MLNLVLSLKELNFKCGSSFLFLLPQFFLFDLLTAVAAGELLRFPRSSWGTFTYDVRNWERGGWLKADDHNDSLRDNDQSPIAQSM